MSIVAKTRTNFAYFCPTVINFGIGASAGAADMAKMFGVKKVMVVTDDFLAEAKRKAHHRIAPKRRAQSRRLARRHPRSD